MKVEVNRGKNQYIYYKMITGEKFLGKLIEETENSFIIQSNTWWRKVLKDKVYKYVKFKTTFLKNYVSIDLNYDN